MDAETKVSLQQHSVLGYDRLHFYKVALRPPEILGDFCNRSKEKQVEGKDMDILRLQKGIGA